MNRLDLRNGSLELPVFLPDATRAVVRGVGADDLVACGVPGLVMSTFHLMQHPGSSVVAGHGGLHRFAGWGLPIITDSGGFQVYSLVHENPKYGSLSEKGMVFRTDDGAKYNLTPEKSIQLQLSYASDVVYCLDDCTHPDAGDSAQIDSVRRTIKWAKRCREVFDQIVAGKRLAGLDRPRLFAVVQGGAVPALRQQCAEALLEIGFDGYGFGGFPIDGERRLLEDIFAYLRELIPAEYPLHALGVGHPGHVKTCADLGYAIFDSALPTRDARRGRLYRFTGESVAAGTDWFEFIYLEDGRHTRTAEPISERCDCAACARYSLAYLRHLYEIEDALYIRLATVHNLRFMTQLMEYLRTRATDG
ncbi:MAG: queuine tRNA-ribosyltransferase family protein [Anaerolineae bacterium]|nr:queuine tRNA-ribosyltransferase family protein [Anaerolineae bacterium]NUQ02432.1 queuine tRNA-ribosyltransferase family protein [Anaerolineae bacterium]